jgi:hypothetical protein
MAARMLMCFGVDMDAPEMRGNKPYIPEKQADMQKEEVDIDADVEDEGSNQNSESGGVQKEEEGGAGEDDDDKDDGSLVGGGKVNSSNKKESGMEKEKEEKKEKEKEKGKGKGKEEKEKGKVKKAVQLIKALLWANAMLSIEFLINLAIIDCMADDVEKTFAKLQLDKLTMSEYMDAIMDLEVELLKGVNADGYVRRIREMIGTYFNNIRYEEFTPELERKARRIAEVLVHRFGTTMMVFFPQDNLITCMHTLGDPYVILTSAPHDPRLLKLHSDLLFLYRDMIKDKNEFLLRHASIANAVKKMQMVVVKKTTQIVYNRALIAEKEFDAEDIFHAESSSSSSSSSFSSSSSASAPGVPALLLTTPARPINEKRRTRRKSKGRGRMDVEK